jgi:uncharacterized protein YjiS (DUF1127 family)
MQYVTAHGTMERNAGRAGFTGWAAELVQRLRQRIEEHARYTQTRDELLALSDRELHDIGLNRVEVETIARRSCRHG